MRLCIKMLGGTAVCIICWPMFIFLMAITQCRKGVLAAMVLSRICAGVSPDIRSFLTAFFATGGILPGFFFLFGVVVILFGCLFGWLLLLLWFFCLY